MTSATEGQETVLTLLRTVCRLAIAQQQQLRAMCIGDEAQIQLSASAFLASSLVVQQDIGALLAHSCNIQEVDIALKDLLNELVSTCPSEQQPVGPSQMHCSHPPHQRIGQEHVAAQASVDVSDQACSSTRSTSGTVPQPFCSGKEARVIHSTTGHKRAGGMLESEASSTLQASHQDSLLAVPAEALGEAIASFALRVRSDLLQPRKVATLPPDLRAWAETDSGRFPWITQMRGLLRDHWGHDDFRGMQLPVINGLMSHRDVLAVMPTGSGKSLCYQLPALQLPGTAVVISPLLSLMHDQVQAMQLQGVNAARLGSDTSKTESASVFEDLAEGRLQLLYVSPERIVGAIENQDRLATALRQRHAAKLISIFVVDEAHCISQWGLDFRKQYRLLACLRRDFPEVPILAVTASATKKIEDDVVRSLRIPRALRFRDTFDRTNLFLEVRNKVSEDQAIKEVAALANRSRSSKGSQPMCGIVYVVARNETERVAKALERLGVRSCAYHAGLTPSKRKESFRKWMDEECQMIVATVAFGMGIDKRNVRLICHIAMPSSIERYHQEIGRAGRDGGPCRCIVWFSDSDIVRHKKLAHKQREIDQVEEARRFFKDESRCRHAALVAYFGEDPSHQSCDACDVCVYRRSHLPMGGSTSAAQPKHLRDVTEQARKLLDLAETLTQHGVTTVKLRDAARGRKIDGTGLAKSLSAAASSHRHFGCLKEFSQEEAEEIVHKLLELKILSEHKSAVRRFGKRAFQRPAAIRLQLNRPLAEQLKHGKLKVVLGNAPCLATSHATRTTPQQLHQTSQDAVKRRSRSLSPLSQAQEPTRLAAAEAGPASVEQPSTKRRRSRCSAGAEVETATPTTATTPKMTSTVQYQDFTTVAEDIESSGDELVIVGGGASQDDHIADLPFTDGQDSTRRVTTQDRGSWWTGATADISKSTRQSDGQNKSARPQPAPLAHNKQITENFVSPQANQQKQQHQQLLQKQEQFVAQPTFGGACPLPQSLHVIQQANQSVLSEKQHLPSKAALRNQLRFSAPNPHFPHAGS